ncbi:hypothetical protein PISMIDRAFT_315477 [Pisolithus microcarpus 441]|uniref:Uncharacterized protein n=1 Tax=Pisolithus microcarpus 441 TaxID=765257 RepID=A0A0D0A1N8_9AGAM|nr:hypothetical protein PISMIDRAFT_315477 [Pisolithus microcarpus 441]
MSVLTRCILRIIMGPDQNSVLLNCLCALSDRHDRPDSVIFKKNEGTLVKWGWLCPLLPTAGDSIFAFQPFPLLVTSPN